MRDKTVIVNVRTFLLDGTEVMSGTAPATPMRINLRRHDCIAGVRYGIEGMRVGGKRELIISPHLAYGARGLQDRVPPSATLRCEVELLEVRERGLMKPEDYPPGRQLIVGWLGDHANGVAKWQFGLNENGHCGATVSVPIPGLKWRHSRPKNVDMQLDPARAAALFESAAAMPARFLKDCLTAEQVCVDYSGNEGGVRRDRRTNALCYAITMWERGQVTCQYFLAEDSKALLAWDLREIIRELVDKA